MDQKPGNPPPVKPPPVNRRPVNQGSGKKRPEHSDSWERTMFILRQSKRQLIGLFLLCVVGGIILYVATRPKVPASASPRNSTRTASGDDSVSVASNDESTDVDNLNDDSSTTDSPPSNYSQKANSGQPESLEDFLNSASPSELIAELLKLRRLTSPSLPVSFVNVQRRSTIAKRVLELDITDDQMRFVTNDYIESIIQLDAINKKGKLNAAHVREEMIAVRDKYSGDANESIGAKASLVYILASIHDFFESEDEAELANTADLFDLHADKILRHADTSARLVKLVCDLYTDSDYSAAHKEFATRVMKRIEQHKNSEVKSFAKLLGEQIFFAKSELGSLVDRIEGGNVIAREDVQSLFEGLDANPSSRMDIYKVATNVIAEYSRLGKTEDADALTKWLVSINERNETKEEQELINQAIERFKKLQKEKATSTEPQLK